MENTIIPTKITDATSDGVSPVTKTAATTASENVSRNERQKSFTKGNSNTPFYRALKKELENLKKEVEELEAAEREKVDKFISGTPIKEGEPGYEPEKKINIRV